MYNKDPINFLKGTLITGGNEMFTLKLISNGVLLDFAILHVIFLQKSSTQYLKFWLVLIFIMHCEHLCLVANTNTDMLFFLIDIGIDFYL